MTQSSRLFPLGSAKKDLSILAKISAWYDAIFYALFVWYSRETKPNESDDDAIPTAWAFVSVFGSFTVVAVEHLAYLWWERSFILWSGWDVPSYFLFSWSFPILLLMNYFIFMRRGRGYEKVLRYRRGPERMRSRAKIVGASFAIGSTLAAVVTTLATPPL